VTQSYDAWKLAEPPSDPGADKRADDLHDAKLAVERAWDKFARVVADAEKVHCLSPWAHRMEVVGKLDSLTDIIARCRELDTRHHADEPDWCRAQLITLIECMEGALDNGPRGLIQYGHRTSVRAAYCALVDAEERLSDAEKAVEKGGDE
jgi:hypothetical protein